MPAKDGDKVKVHYTLKDANGEVVETSINSEPIDFTIGAGNVIPGFEKAVRGMELNEKKKIEIEPEDAYGPHDEKKIFEYDRSKAPQDFNPQIGQTIQLHRPDGNSFTATVLGETETGFKMDANHPLAGKKLDFDVELVEIVSK
ncbi:FKBP-type 16 kDa peptidyl-prolyl cis-trans isomerase [bacterium BMS3Bbin09]|nr:FKBP-type 16 kDa peptidyl-prolyl cis-trans isomerase [bacterium BMS3Bbin09]HDH34214.1 peptidylprolyl isomerase [Nitrospirota bacterium]HDN94842.1 peptidylprolyl isomerase [Nitrospirota bacterium]